MASTASKIILRDGRTLAYRTIGAPAGHPIIFTHGNLNSRLFHPAWEKTDAQTCAANAHVIAVDRPGVGLSSPHPSRTYSTFADDIQQLTATLSLPTFSIIGFSSGGPHALACAAYSVPNLASCSLVSSDAPYLVMPGMTERLYGTAVVTHEHAVGLSRTNAKGMRLGYAAMSKPTRVEIAMADVDAATRQGYDGPASDSVLETGDWGFPLRMSEGMPPLRVWHGTEDYDVPVEAGRYLVAECFRERGDEYFEIEGESHTLIRRHWQGILEETIRAAIGE